MKENGKKTICMEKVFIHGKTEEDMKENILKIKNMDMVSIFGKMEENMKDNGKMENKMGKDNIQN